MIDDLRLRNLASEQHGIVSLEQVIGLGYSAEERRALADGRRWERAGPGALRLVGTPLTERSRLSLEVLSAGPGAHLNAMTALAVWGVRGAVVEPIQLARPRNRAQRTGRATAHEPLLLPPHHLVRLDGLPVVVPARALFEVAGSQRRGAELPWWVERVERLVNNALTAHLVSGASLHAMLGDLAQRGRPGIRVMRQILQGIGPDHVAPASGLETRVAQRCEQIGVPAMRRQVDVGDGRSWVGRVDFVAVDVPFVLEVQSEVHHTSRLDVQLDAERFARLDAAGFVVGTVTDVDVWHRPHVIDRVIREGRARALARRSGSQAA